MKKTIYLIFILSFVFVLAACSPSSPEQTTDENAPNSDILTVGMELAYPPFETKDDAGNPTGVSVDLAKAFGKYLGKEVVIKNIAWDGLIPSLQTGKIDMIISSMTITEDREKVVDFTNPYSNSSLAVLTNKSSGITSIEDFNQAGKRIAVKNGTTGYMYAKNNLTNTELVILDDVAAAITEVAQGKSDGFIYDQLTIYRNYKENEDTTTAIFIPFQDADMWGAAVADGNTELKDKFNTFLDEFKNNGGFDTITEKYLAEEKAAFDDFGFTWFFDIK